MEERFVLSHVVGVGLEGDLQDILDLVSFWHGEDNSGAGAFIVLGPIEVENPPLLVLHRLG
jgi:hypothetical protein